MTVFIDVKGTPLEKVVKNIFKNDRWNKNSTHLAFEFSALPFIGDTVILNGCSWPNGVDQVFSNKRKPTKIKVLGYVHKLEQQRTQHAESFITMSFEIIS